MCISQNVGKRRPLTYFAVPSNAKNELVVSDSVEPIQDARHEKHHHVVKHDYHDHAHDEMMVASSPVVKKPVARGGVTTPFPEKLYDMLAKIEEDGHAHVVSWQPHGRCFVVRKPKEFVETVMPIYFKQSRYASFQRQLNLYGFIRLTKKGQDKGGYYHELFLRGKPELLHKIHRIKVKGTGVRARSNPETEPDFYAMPPIVSEESATTSTSSSTCAEAPQPAYETTCSSSVPVMTTSQPPLYEGQLQDQLLQQELGVSNQDDDDDVIMFEGKPFHYLNPLEADHQRLPPAPQKPTAPVSDDDEEPEMFSRKEMENFLHDLDLPSELYNDILETVEGDEGLGHLLERIIE